MTAKQKGELVVVIPIVLLLIIRTIDLFVYGEYTAINIVFFVALALCLSIYFIDFMIKRKRGKRALEK